MSFERLFAPIKIKNMELRNRLVMPAIHHKYTPDGLATEQFNAYYNRRAEGGIGLIIVGGCRIDEYGASPGFIALNRDDAIPGYQEFTDGIHERGAKVCAQLYHAGRYTRIANTKGNIPAYSPSATTSRYTKEQAQEMTIEDIRMIQDSFASAALRAKKMGFDAVEICACSGYLIPQFLSKLTNFRTDEYGGSEENRCRFAKEVVERIREAVGEDYPILMRIAGNDFMVGGGGMEESAMFARRMEAAGVDAFNVTGGWHESPIPQITGDLPAGGYTYLAHHIKQTVSVPVLASNRMADPHVAEETLALGKSDLINLGRVMIADPEWPNKVRQNRSEEIRSCVACNQGCLANSFFQRPLACLVNGMVGKEYMYEKDFQPAQKKKLLVVGGGPGGCEVAIRAALLGHSVTLWEKNEEIGGQLPLVGAPTPKKEFLNMIRYYKNMLKTAGVAVELCKEGSAENVLAFGADVVITATGAIPSRFPLSGEEHSKIPVYTAHQYLEGGIIAGKNTVVVGGGSVGCEAAHVLAEDGSISPDLLYFLMTQQAEPIETIQKMLNTTLRKVSIVEIQPGIGKGFDPGTGWPLLKDLKRLGVDQHPSSSIIDMDDTSVTIQKKQKDGEEVTLKIPCDTIVMAVGSKSNSALYNTLKEKNITVHNLGDSKQIGKIIDAIQLADELAMNL